MLLQPASLHKVQILDHSRDELLRASEQRRCGTRCKAESHSQNAQPGLGTLIMRCSCVQTASALSHMDNGIILPSSTRKIERAKAIFDQCDRPHSLSARPA